MGRLFRDLRYVLRSLRAAPGFTSIAVLTLALGIGANTAIFSVINTVLLKPLSFPEPDRMVSLMSNSKRGANRGGSPTKFNTWRAQADILQDVTAYDFRAINVTSGETPEQVPSAQVSEGFFRLFGSSLVMDRGFTVEEDRPNGPKVVVVSDGLWRRLGAPPDILNKTISLDGEARPVVGVLGPNLDKSIDQAPDVVEPFQIDPESTNQGHYFRLMSFTVEQRTQEIGIRMALGAGAAALRGMIVRQGMLLAVIGIALGLAAAYGLTRLLTAFLFGVKPVDPLVFAAVPVVLALVSLMAIWVPASRATRVDPALALRRE